jgi:hypothetical protein
MSDTQTFWYKIVDYQGSPFKFHQGGSVVVPPKPFVDDLRKAVHERMGKDFFDGIHWQCLQVFEERDLNKDLLACVPVRQEFVEGMAQFFIIKVPSLRGQGESSKFGVVEGHWLSSDSSSGSIAPAAERASSTFRNSTLKGPNKLGEHDEARGNHLAAVKTFLTDFFDS